MNKQELQIGNLVSLNGHPVQVRTVTSKKVGVLTSNEHTQLCYARFHEIEPIPITKEFYTRTDSSAWWISWTDTLHSMTKK